MKNMGQLGIIMKGEDVVRHILLKWNGNNGNHQRTVFLIGLPVEKSMLVQNIII
jgi:hypothetical protein